MGKTVELKITDYKHTISDTVNFSTFTKKDTRLLNHSVAASKALLSHCQVYVHMHVVQRQLIYLTTVCGIRPGQVDCKGAEIHCI